MSTEYHIEPTKNVKSVYAKSVWCRSSDGDLEVSRSLSMKNAVKLVEHLESIADLDSIVEIGTPTDQENVTVGAVDMGAGEEEIVDKHTTHNIKPLDSFAKYRDIERKFRNWLSVYDGDFTDIDFCCSKDDFIAAQNGLLIPERFDVKRRHSSQTSRYDFSLVKLESGKYVYQDNLNVSAEQIEIGSALRMLKYVLSRTDVQFSFFNHSTINPKDQHISMDLTEILNLSTDMTKLG